MRSSSLFLSACLTLVSSLAFAHARPSPQLAARDLPIKTLYQFPNSTWVENSAFRPNGQLLVSLVTNASIYQIDPAGKQKATLVHRFTEKIGLYGLTEIGPDVFAVVAGNVSNTTPLIPRSFSVYKVDLNGYTTSPSCTVKPTITKIADIPEAIFLNGMTLLAPGSPFVLIADCGAGKVWRLNTLTGKYTTVLQDVTMQPSGLTRLPLGINGVDVENGTLYYTNTNKGLLVTVPLKADGTAAGPYKTVATGLHPADLAVDARGTSYVAENTYNRIVKVTADGTQSVIAGNRNSSALAGPTSCIFGQSKADRNTIYITTNGGFAAPINGSYIEGGKVASINLY